MFPTPAFVLEQPAKPTESQKIEALIQVLEHLKDASSSAMVRSTLPLKPLPTSA